MRKKIVAGNWKMNGDQASAKTLFNDLSSQKSSFPNNVDVMVAPSFIFLNELVEQKDSGIKVVAQNCAAS